MNRCLLRGFQALLRKSQSSELSRCCAGTFDFVQSYGMQYESENLLSGVPLGIFPRKTLRSQWRTGERFHQDILAVGKRYEVKCTASVLADCCWIMTRDVPDKITGESHTALRYVGTLLPVSWARKVLICIITFICTLEDLPDRKILFTYLNSE